MKRNNDALEEHNMFVTQRDCKTADNCRQNIQEFSCSIEFMILMNKCQKAIVNCLSNHLSSRHKLSGYTYLIPSHKACAKCSSSSHARNSPRNQTARETKECNTVNYPLDELWRYANLHAFHVCSVVEYQLQEKLIYALLIN